MYNNEELNEWTEELTETIDQLGRLSEQLDQIKNQNFSGMIGRIQHLQRRLDYIKDIIENLKGSNAL